MFMHFRHEADRGDRYPKDHFVLDNISAASACRTAMIRVLIARELVACVPTDARGFVRH